MSIQATINYKLAPGFNEYLDFALNLFNSSLYDLTLKILIKEEINIENSLSNIIILVLKLDYFSKIRLSNEVEIQKAYNNIKLFYLKQENGNFDYAQCELKLNALYFYDHVIKSNFYTNELESKFKSKIINHIKNLKESNIIQEDSTLVDGNFEDELLFYESYYEESQKNINQDNFEDEYYQFLYFNQYNSTNSKINRNRIENLLNQYLLENGKVPDYQYNAFKYHKLKIFQIEKVIDHSKNSNIIFINQNLFNQLKNNKLVGQTKSKLTIMNSFNFIEFKRERLDKIIYRDFLSYLQNNKIENDELVKALMSNKCTFPLKINNMLFKSINTSFLLYIFSYELIASLFDSYISDFMDEILNKIKSKLNKNVSSAYYDQLKFYLMNYSKIYANKLG